MAVITATDEIVHSIRGDKVGVGDILTYEDTGLNALNFLDDDIPNVRAVKGIINQSTRTIVSIPANSSIPFSIDMTLPQFVGIVPGSIMQVEQLLNGNFATATNSRIIFDVVVEKDYTSAARNTYASVQVYGHVSDADPTLTQDHLILIMA